MLHYLHELHAARRATPGRRRYNVISGVLFILIGGSLILAAAPLPVIVAFICADFALDIALVVIWARRDALDACWQRDGEP